MNRCYSGSGDQDLLQWRLIDKIEVEWENSLPSQRASQLSASRLYPVVLFHPIYIRYCKGQITSYSRTIYLTSVFLLLSAFIFWHIETIVLRHCPYSLFQVLMRCGSSNNNSLLTPLTPSVTYPKCILYFIHYVTKQIATSYTFQGLSILQTVLSLIFFSLLYNHSLSLTCSSLHVHLTFQYKP